MHDRWAIQTDRQPDRRKYKIYIYIKYIYNHTAIERCFLKKARLTLKQTQLKPPISKTNKSKSSEQSTAQFSCFSSIRVAGGKGGGIMWEKSAQHNDKDKYIHEGLRLMYSDYGLQDDKPVQLALEAATGPHPQTAVRQACSAGSQGSLQG